ncbi:hypothetical protein BH23BAC1_BH23BAC1_27800 [soil metagenome]
MDKQILFGILMGASKPVLVLDEKLLITSVTQKAQQVLEFEEAELVGQHLIKLIDDAYHSSINSIFSSIQNKESAEDQFIIDCNAVTKNGLLVPVNLSINRITEENDLRVIVIFNETISARKSLQPGYEEFPLFSRLADHSNRLVVLHDEEDNILFTNNLFQKYLGFGKEESLKMKITGIVQSDDIIKLKNKNEIVRIQDKNKQNRIFNINRFNYLDQEKNKEYFFMILEDITSVAEKNGGSAKIEKQFIQESWIDFLPDIYLKIDKEGIIKEALAGKKEDLLIHAQELPGKPLDQIFDPENVEILKKAFQEAVTENNIVTIDFESVFPDNQVKHFEARIIPVPNEKFIAILRNVSEKMIVQKQLIAANLEAEKESKVKDDFMSVMSHEIRTPLNAVIGMTQLLIRRNPTPEQLELLNTIKFSGENLLKIINDILDLSKIKAAKIEFEEIDFNLRKLVKNIRLSHKNLAIDKGIKLKLFVDDDVPEWVKGDYTKLNQILNNLINNALKFTEEGSVSLDIYVDNQTNSQVSILFEVSDTGIGIPKDKQDLIFDPFHQASISTSRKYGGTGLGLSIIKSMVELQKGRIEVESEEGKGSVFRVYLTFNKAPEHLYTNYSVTQTDLPEYKQINDLKILYVEDVESNQLLINNLCKDWGVQLVLAQNGFEALSKVQSELPDIILMDIQMPDMDGYEATRRIRGLAGDYFKEIPIIAVTAEVSEHSKLMIREVGMNDYLLKPLDTDELYQKLSIYSTLIKKKNQKNNISDIQPQYIYVDFSKTEELYKNDNLGFVKLLNLLVREFESYHVQILKVVKERDLKGLSFVKHKVSSTIQSFKLNELGSLLVKLQHLMANEPESINEKKLLEECDLHFHSILADFQQKIQEATSLNQE